MRHLTTEQRQRLRDLFSEADQRELLLAVAGIIRHDTDDYVTAMEAADLINRAANSLAQ